MDLYIFKQNPKFNASPVKLWRQNIQLYIGIAINFIQMI